MATQKSTHSAELELNRLELRVAELIKLCSSLREENAALRMERQEIAAERSELIEKNRQVKTRVETMIDRLKGMERSA